jgi:uncharacterized delta-60 repeat protein
MTRSLVTRSFLISALLAGLVLLLGGPAQGNSPTQPTADDIANALVLQPDGKLVAAGVSRRDLALARYRPNGSLDTSFGGDGTVTARFGAVAALVAQPDGKLVVAGTSADDDFALARFNPNGSLDTSFGVGGKVTTVFGSEASVASTLVLQPDGKLVAGGRTDGDSPEFALARYNPNGSLDTSFGTGGKVTTALGPEDDEIWALVLQPDGKLVAAGQSTDGSNEYFALARYEPNGTLDTGFNHTGTVTTKIRSGGNGATALVPQRDGKLVAAGLTFKGTQQDRLSADFALGRYIPNGSLDASFGRGGEVTTAFWCLVPHAKGMKLPLARLAIQREGLLARKGEQRVLGQGEERTSDLPEAGTGCPAPAGLEGQARGQPGQEDAAAMTAGYRVVISSEREPVATSVPPTVK